ncbi:flagellar export chaperone FliS [bacterium]|nr:flagellar export chaperone FliS [bacterium]MBU0900297.1 flagellar export chaperone FliS [bacterium]MBU1153371.1 flagellar export chaperone FliS [bacterium]MBU1781951.1 flagellar export chaperone FliS [bacterium]MBU2599269.1 flagellar export chaperone FliS [bacterium]
MPNPYESYRQTRISTASQGQLILMLYDGAVKFLNLANEAIPKKEFMTANTNIIKSQNIITELMVSLNMEVGEIAKNLYSLYDYMNRRLIQANIKKDPKIINEVKGMLLELREVWDQAIKKTGGKY